MGQLHTKKKKINKFRNNRLSQRGSEKSVNYYFLET